MVSTEDNSDRAEISLSDYLSSIKIDKQRFDPADVASFFRIKHDEYNDVMLITCTVIGYMQAGKSTVVNYIANRIKQANPGYRYCFILTRYFDKLFKLHTSKYSELREIIKNSDVIVIHIDDALETLHVQKHKKELEIHFAKIRHYMRCLIESDKYDKDFYTTYSRKGGKATLIIFFSTQRYQQLAPMMREGGIQIYKAVDLNPTHDPKNFFLRMLGNKYIAWLRENAFKVHILKSKRAMCYYLLKAVGAPPAIYRFKPVEDVGWIEIAKDKVIYPNNKKELYKIPYDVEKPEVDEMKEKVLKRVSKKLDKKVDTETRKNIVNRMVKKRKFRIL